MSTRASIEFKGGRLPADPSKPRLTFAGFKSTQLPPAPPSIDLFSEVSDWPMYLNNSIGDCTIATVGHMVESWTTYGQRITKKITDNDVLKAYEAVSGYDPKTKTNDNGAVVQDVLNYWRKTGIGGTKIVAFASVDVKNIEECKQAAAIFGGIYLGINFPASAMDQFNRGEPWDVVKGSTNEGGHAIPSAWYDTASGLWKVITWGAVQPMTQAFWEEYVEEAWAVISEDFFDPSTGKNPAGLDFYALGEQFTALTGEPNPFPQPSPQPSPSPSPQPGPAPTPAPAPTPEPSPTDPSVALGKALKRYVATKSAPSYLKGPAEAWLAQQKS